MEIFNIIERFQIEKKGGKLDNDVWNLFQFSKEKKKNSIKLFQHFYHLFRKRLNKNIIETFNWLNLGNKYGILFVYKRNKEKNNR